MEQSLENVPDFYLIPSLHGANIIGLVIQEGNMPVDVVLLLGHNGFTTGLTIHLSKTKKLP